MDLTEIVAITGVAGLHHIIGRRSTGLIVETLDEKKTRFATTLTQKVSILDDISMYTKGGDVRLAEVMQKVNEYAKSGKSLPDGKADNEQLKKAFGDILPDFDEERVYASDIKKLFTWYGILSRYTNIDELLAAKEEIKEETEGETKAEGEPKAEKKKAAPKKEAPKTKTAAPKTSAAKGAKAAAPRKTGGGG